MGWLKKFFLKREIVSLLNGLQFGSSHFESHETGHIRGTKFCTMPNEKFYKMTNFCTLIFNIRDLTALGGGNNLGVFRPVEPAGEM